MRRSKRVLENGLSSRSGVSSSVEASASEINSKRKKLTCSKTFSTPDTVSDRSPAKKGKGSVKLVTSSQNLKDGHESSDSSSNEFEKPDLSCIEMEDIKYEEKDDFASIEDNILADVARLSESEDSEFEEILPVPSPVKEKTTTRKDEPRAVMPSPVKPKVEEAKKRRGRKRFNDQEGKTARVPAKVNAKKSSGRNSAEMKGPEKLEDIKKPELDVNKMDVTQLLALGESFAESCKEEAVVDMAKIEASTESESGEEGDWEEVTGESEVKQEEKRHVIPKEGVQITLDAPELFHRRKKKGFDLEACLKRRINRNKRGIQVHIHKVHLLCWIAHGRCLNAVLNSQNLMGVALSLLPSNHCYPPNRTDLDYLEKVVTWFRKTVPIVFPKEPPPSAPMETSLEVQFRERKARSIKDLVLMFVCAMRSLGIKARLILSLQPAPLKPPSHELCSIGPRMTANSKKGAVSSLNPSESIDLPPIVEESPSTSKSSSAKPPKKAMGEEESKRPAKQVVDKSRIGNKSTSSTSATTSKNPYLDKAKASSSRVDDKSGPSSKFRTCQKKQHNHESDSSDLEIVAESKIQRVCINKTSKGKLSKASESATKSVKARDKKGPPDDDSDFEPEVLFIKKSKGVTVKDRKVLSSSSENEEKNEVSKTNKREGVDVWAEVFLEMEEKWISVDLLTGKVHCVVELHAKATSPVLYILAFGNDLCFKDVSRRYCPQWMSVTQKKRVDERWWKHTIDPFRPPRNALDYCEEEEMDAELESRPLPTGITEYKGHPLYALKRHLLKFEAIFPPNAPTLGFIRGEPVYSRDCVHQLHSRETWIKEAKLVRLGEKPYKIVKARPKYDKMSGKIITDLPLELFGLWQVDDYIPPPAIDGKVPRNEYGNVDLYKSCMLPAGTVHLRLPGLNRVAKKLQLDCVPAVVGFDFHSGGSHPMFDGFVVCEEFKEILIDAWNQEQEEQEKRQREKREKRVYGNWVRLVRGLLIRESLRNKYSFGEVGESSSSGNKKRFF